MYTTLLYAIGIPFLLVLGTTLGLHLLGRILFLSSHRRAKKLFADSLWLPLRFSSEPIQGEDVEFKSSGRVTLRGTYITHRSPRHKGTVLFCHEFNGTQESIKPYVENLVQTGFDILTFDLRNHGKSDFVHHTFPTPWVTTTDMDDIRAAIDYLESRPETEPGGLCVFGFGKGATLALCAAGSDPRIRSIVLDAPARENKLFTKNCRDILMKSLRVSRKRTSRFVTLFVKAMLYMIVSPVLTVVHAWHRTVLGLWYGCRFVNPQTFVKNVCQPTLILYGHVDAAVCAGHAQALRHRMVGNQMVDRPRLWFVSPEVQPNENGVDEASSRQVARFFEEAVTREVSL